jgi:hypothetical protein
MNSKAPEGISIVIVSTGAGAYLGRWLASLREGAYEYSLPVSARKHRG